ncbi:MAG: hypothetical protein IT317_19435 [Anaerolineales bacterium]|nr:hypothetical protein [Anaerolineales bacterium]
MGEFIEITLDADLIPLEAARRLAGLCPVDIFAVEAGHLVVRPANEDECTLCELCLAPAPAGSLVIHKRYSGENLVARG